MTPEEMKNEGIRIVKRFAEQEVSNGEGMVILAMTLAYTFKTNKVSKFEAINRFATIANNVYGDKK
jgi:hypothetical protein